MPTWWQTSGWSHRCGTQHAQVTACQPSACALCTRLPDVRALCPQSGASARRHCDECALAAPSCKRLSSQRIP
eukprot:364640-Chlamydomonas_euryale.AAC.14